MIYFVGAGSGAPDLITVRGRKLLDSAEIVIYAGSLVNPELLRGVPAGAEIYNSASMDLDQIMEIMYRAHEEGKMLVRLHTGDPSLYGAVREQMDRLQAHGISFAVCPGVSSFSGAAASLQAEYTLPGVSQTLILTRMEGRTPVPDRERLRKLAEHGASMAIFLSAGMTEKVQEELIASGGYDPDTPCAVVYKATWPDERIVRTDLAHLPEETARAGIRKTALILVGDFLGSEYELSKLYDKHFSTEYRPASAGTQQPEKCGMDPYSGRRVRLITALCFTDRGEMLGGKLQDVRVLRHGRDFQDTAALTAQLFASEDAILFISAAGIAVRSIAARIKSKQTDPAVLVLDDAGRFVIPILSGHLGGANAMAEELAEQTGSRAVITTASEGSGIESIDLRAQRSGYHIRNMAAARTAAAAMLRGRPAQIMRVADETDCGTEPDAIMIFTASPAAAFTLTPKRYVLGIGCRKGTDPEKMMAFVETELEKLGIREEQVYAVCSIDDKAGEEAIHRTARRYTCPYMVFSAEQLEQMPGDFSGSDFVKQTVGTDNVCERSAMAGCGGRFERFALRKTAASGMTLAVARRKPDPEAF